MAYAPAGSTAGANPPMLISSFIGGGSTHGSTVSSTLIGQANWEYISSHTQVEVGTSDFITDPLKLGMKPGDSFVNKQISAKHTYHRIISLTSTSATLSAGLCISSAS